MEEVAITSRPYALPSKVAVVGDGCQEELWGLVSIPYPQHGSVIDALLWEVLNSFCHRSQQLKEEQNRWERSEEPESPQEEPICFAVEPLATIVPLVGVLATLAPLPQAALWGPLLSLLLFAFELLLQLRHRFFGEVQVLASLVLASAGLKELVAPILRRPVALAALALALALLVVLLVSFSTWLSPCCRHACGLPDTGILALSSLERIWWRDPHSSRVHPPVL